MALNHKQLNMKSKNKDSFEDLKNYAVRMHDDIRFQKPFNMEECVYEALDRIKKVKSSHSLSNEEARELQGIENFFDVMRQGLQYERRKFAREYKCLAEFSIKKI